MKHTYSLMQILRDDPDFAGALTKATQDVEKSKESLLNASKTITKKYEKEIQEGTVKRQLMIAEGKANGIVNEEYNFKDNKTFIPTIHTPILNLLYFMFKEDMATNLDAQKTNKSKLEELTEFYINQYGYDEYIKKLEEGTTYQKEVYSDELDAILSDDSYDPVEMETYIYGNLTVADFKKVKKLKALSKSSNEHEAFLAYKKCLELCKKYNLEFDKVPCDV